MDAFAWIITVLHHFVLVFPKKHQYWDGYTLFYPCVLGSSPWNPHFWIFLIGRSVDPISFHRSRRLRAAAWHLDLQLPHHCLRPVAAGPWAGRRHHARPPGPAGPGDVQRGDAGLSGCQAVAWWFQHVSTRCFKDVLMICCFFLRIFFGFAIHFFIPWFSNLNSDPKIEAQLTDISTLFHPLTKWGMTPTDCHICMTQVALGLAVDERHVSGPTGEGWDHVYHSIVRRGCLTIQPKGLPLPSLEE